MSTETRIELLKRYLEEDPSDSFLRYALAIEYIGLLNKEDALFQLTQLLNDEPDYLAAYYMAGKTAQELSKNEDALLWFSKGIEVAKMKKDQHTLNELTSAYNQLNDEAY